MLLHSAICVQCTIQEYQAQNGAVQVQFFMTSLQDELVCYSSTHKLKLN
jgi:hypothetical protein